MIACPRCGKENKDHFKYCLGCGAPLPKPEQSIPKAKESEASPALAKTEKPPETVKEPVRESADEGNEEEPASPPEGSSTVKKPADAPAAGEVECSKCGQANPASFRFCGACGGPLEAEEPEEEGTSIVSAISADAPSAAVKGKLVLIKPDGSEGATYEIVGEECTVGRESGEPFASDPFMSPEHATFIAGDGDVTLRDEGSLNGVYLRVEPERPVKLADGAMFRVGQEILRYDAWSDSRSESGVTFLGTPDPGFVGRVSLVIGRETDGNAFCIPTDGIQMGRERGEILFPDDGYVSGLHCSLAAVDDEMFLTDLGSSNGTYVRVADETTLQDGDLLLLGQQLFRIDI